MTINQLYSIFTFIKFLSTMKSTTLLLLHAAVTGGMLSAQNIQNTMVADLVPSFDAANEFEKVGGDHTLDTNTTNPGFFESVYGQISGNTISKAAFSTAVSNAHANGMGGVINFEPGNVSYSGGDYIHPTAGVINRTGADKMQAGGVIIRRGPNWYFEGDAVSPYKGKHTADFDGTGPSGPDRSNYDEVFFMDPSGGVLGLTTSYDLDFDPSDMIGIVGFGILNWDGNFQSQQDESKAYANYPNLHAIATFTNGVDTVTQMAVGLTSVNEGNDYYFGFEAPAGYFLDRVQAYAIGNNSRVFIDMDDLGFVQVPEPRFYALAFAGLAALVVYRRKRKA